MGISSFSSSNAWQDYKSTSYKSNVSSLKSNIKEDFSNDLNKFKTIVKDAATAFVDLEDDISEQAKTNWKTLTSTFTAVGASLGEQVNELETGAKQLVSKFNSALSNLNKKTYELGQKIEDKLFEAGEWIQNKENWKKVGATIVVGGASVLTGIGDLGEKLVDGLAWCGGKIVEAGSFIVAKIQEKTGHEEAAKKTMDWRETMKTDLAGWISHDYVKEFEKYLFEDTKAGQAINAASWLKYDSKVAQGISNVTEKVAEFAAATAITIATGGAGFPAFAAVFGTGFVAGVGGSAEKNYAKAKAEGKKPSIDDKNLNILIDGIGSGFNWYAQGQMGKGISEALKAISKVGAKTFSTTLVSGLKDSIANLKGKSAKEVMSFLFSKANLKTSLFSADNLTDSGGVVADNIASWLNGDEEFNLKNVLGAGAELLGTSLINIVTGGIIDHAGKIDDAAEGAENILKNSDDIIDSANDVPKSADDIKKLRQEYDDLVAYTNSEKGGFDAVYGGFSANGAAKIRYDESVARIREIEDILRNVDDVSQSAKNADDVIEIIEDVSKKADEVTSINTTAPRSSASDNFVLNKDEADELFRRNQKEFDYIPGYEDYYELRRLQSVERNLDSSKGILDAWGKEHNVDNYFEKALKQYAETGSVYQLKNGKKVPYITSEGNVRKYIESLDPKDVAKYLDDKANGITHLEQVFKVSDDVIDPSNIAKNQKEYDELLKQTESDWYKKVKYDEAHSNVVSINESDAARKIDDRLAELKKYLDDTSTTNTTTARNATFSLNQDEIFRRQEMQRNLDSCSDILDRWGAKNNASNYAEQALRQYAETGSVYQLIDGEWKPYITSEGNVRAYIESLDPADVKRYLDSDILKNSDNVEMYSFFKDSGSPINGTYGVSQTGIKDLCEYSLNGKHYDSNGKKYTYSYVRDLVNEAKLNGDPIPNFKKVATKEYGDLKKKLISMGFENGQASVILSSLDDLGACSYAAKANAIFYQFSKNPELFEEVFGFPMYKTVNGMKTLNSNELILDLYVYANDVSNGGHLFRKLGNSYDFNLDNRIDVFGRRMLNTEQQVCVSTYSGSNEKTLSGYLQSKGLNYNTTNLIKNNGQSFSDKEWNWLMNNIDESIAKGDSISINIFDRKPPKEIRLISTNPNSYANDTTLRYNGGGHAVAITGKTQDGFLISSYGQEFKIPFSDLKNGGYFNIMVDKITQL